MKNCTDTIIRQVSNIEKLVSEFSNFARMPEGNFELTKLNTLIETQINTQKIANSHVNFKFISNKKQIEIHKKLNAVGIETIPLELRHDRLLAGGFHCVTLDLKRKRAS